MDNTESTPAPELPQWPLPNAPTSAWKARPSIPAPAVQKSTRSLVIDTNALIKGSRLEKMATEFYTISEVFDEVTDKQSKHQLAIFPFEIKVRSPTPEAFKKVVEFAKKTGDFPVLSTVDLKVIALTLTLEIEANGSQNIRQEPASILNVPSVPMPEPASNETDSTNEETNTTQDQTQEQKSQSESTPTPAEDNTNAQQTETKDEPEETKKEEDDDDAGWITPDNIKEVTARHHGASGTVDEGRNVACITTDYAMQNVLLQLGLGLLSVDGYTIKTVRQYVLKCSSCNKMTRNMEKKFCPSCGNATLFRLPLTVDSDGKVTYYYARNFKPNLRGTVYSIPLPKGGRKNNDIILTEEHYEQAMRKQKKKSNMDAFDMDYQFASKSDQSKPVVVGYGRRNPNIPKKKTGRNSKGGQRVV